MNGPEFLAAVAVITGLLVFAALKGSDLVREALEEMDARREWRRMCELSEKRRRLSQAPRVMRQ
jgi:hypothetical protein